MSVVLKAEDILSRLKEEAPPIPKMSETIPSEITAE